MTTVAKWSLQVVALTTSRYAFRILVRPLLNECRPVAGH
jgi:hypothetical protein